MDAGCYYPRNCVETAQNAMLLFPSVNLPTHHPLATTFLSLVCLLDYIHDGQQHLCYRPFRREMKRKGNLSIGALFSMDVRIFCAYKERILDLVIFFDNSGYARE